MLHHSGQVHRKEPESYTKLQALVADVLENQQQEKLIAKKRKEAKHDQTHQHQSFPSQAKETARNGDCQTVDVQRFLLTWGGILIQARRPASRNMSGGGGRARLVVLAAEVERSLARRDSHLLGRRGQGQRRVCTADPREPSRIGLASGGGAACWRAAQLLERRPNPRTGADVPPMHEVLRDDRFCQRRCSRRVMRSDGLYFLTVDKRRKKKEKHDKRQRTPSRALRKRRRIGSNSSHACPE